MSLPKLSCALFTFACLLPLPTALAQAPAPPSLPDAQSIATLGSELFLQSGSTGMVIVVVRGDQVFFNGYGETAPNSLQTPTQDSVLRLCSLTKIFTTDVLAKLAADNTVLLRRPTPALSARTHHRAQTHPPHHARQPGDAHLRPFA